jgi:hypothetical protein
MHPLLKQRTISPEFMILTVILCVFVVPAVIALSMIVFPPVMW